MNFMKQYQVDDSEISSDIFGLISSAELSDIFEEVQITPSRKQNLKELFAGKQQNKHKFDALENLTYEQQSSSNKYLCQYLHWKQSQPIQIASTIRAKKISKLQTQLNQADILKKAIQLNIHESSFQKDYKLNEYIQKEEAPYKKDNKQQKLGITKIQTIQLHPIVNTKIQKKQYETSTQDLEQQLIRIRQNQQKLKCSYQSLIENPPLYILRPEQKYVGNQKKNESLIQKKVFSSPKSPFFNVKPSDIIPTQIIPSKINIHARQQKQQQLKKGQLKSFLKNTIQNCDQKAFKKLSQQHKKKVYDILYNI